MKSALPTIVNPALETHRLLRDLADAVRSSGSGRVTSQSSGSSTQLFFLPPTPPLVPLTDFSSGVSGLKGVSTLSIVPDGAFGTPVYYVLYNEQLSSWAIFTDAGSPSDDAAAGIMKPADYNASTNPKVWHRISGTSE